MSEKFTVEFNGYFLTQLFDVTEIRRDGGSGLSSSVGTRRNKKGVRRLSAESTLVTIPMSFYMYDNIIHKRRELSRVLDVDGPCKLIFGDEPDKYYLAMASETLSFEDTRIEATGTITWQIFDGVAYSVDELSFDNNQNPNIIEINNPGTESIDLDLEATFTTDCGFLVFKAMTTKRAHCSVALRKLTVITTIRLFNSLTTISIKIADGR